jgi:hypothetical protein
MAATASSPPRPRGGRYVLLALTLTLAAAPRYANAKYDHDAAEPSGKKHPGCIGANPDWVDRVPSANQTCPGMAMSEVYDFDSELYPFNLKLAKESFDEFFNSNNLVASNDFITPRLLQLCGAERPAADQGILQAWKQEVGVQVRLAGRGRGDERYGLAQQRHRARVVQHDYRQGGEERE